MKKATGESVAARHNTSENVGSVKCKKFDSASSERPPYVAPRQKQAGELAQRAFALMRSFNQVAATGTLEEKRILVRAFLQRIDLDPATHSGTAFFWQVPTVGQDGSGANPGGRGDAVRSLVVMGPASERRRLHRRHYTRWRWPASVGTRPTHRPAARHRRKHAPADTPGTFGAC